MQNPGPSKKLKNFLLVQPVGRHNRRAVEGPLPTSVEVVSDGASGGLEHILVVLGLTQRIGMFRMGEMQIIVLRTGLILLNAVVKNGDARDIRERELVAAEVAEEEIGGLEDGGVVLTTCCAGVRAEEACEVGGVNVPSVHVGLVQQSGAVVHAV